MFSILRFLRRRDWASAWLGECRGNAIGDRSTLFGVGFHKLTLDEAVARAEAMLNTSKSSHIVVTPNSVSLLKSRKNPRLLEAYQRADLVIADGIGIVWASRLLGVPLKERVTGIELAEALLKRSNVNGYRVFLLGGKDKVAARAASRLKARFPELAIVGTHHGYFTEDSEPLAAIRRVRPQILLVALGVPRQEQWMAKYADQLKLPLMIGIGGALDVFSGDRRRASARWQRLGLEWAYRLLHQPRRIKKALAIPCFIGHVLWIRASANLSTVIHLPAEEA